MSQGIIYYYLYGIVHVYCTSQAMARYAQAHPLGRLATAEEIAKIITFLVSDDTSFMTGSVVPVDGGSGITSIFSGMVKMF